MFNFFKKRKENPLDKIIEFHNENLNLCKIGSYTLNLTEDIKILRILNDFDLVKDSVNLDKLSIDYKEYRDTYLVDLVFRTNTDKLLKDFLTLSTVFLKKIDVSKTLPNNSTKSINLRLLQSYIINVEDKKKAIETLYS